MNRISQKKAKRVIRHRRVRSVVKGSEARPRLSVFRSLANIYAQLINDDSGTTLVSAASKEVSGVSGKTNVASEVGKLLASRAKEHNIASVVFDRGGNKYHGRVKALAEGARAGGLSF